jgi:hypothetical protein
MSLVQVSLAGLALGPVVEIVKAIGTVWGAVWALAAQMEFPEPFAGFSEVLGRAELIGPAALGAGGGFLEPPHALVEVIDIGLAGHGLISVGTKVAVIGQPVCNSPLKYSFTNELYCQIKRLL